jgi:hypothetical protein
VERVEMTATTTTAMVVQFHVQ